jgi:iron(II)-dependent oxidoreductase
MGSDIRAAFPPDPDETPRRLVEVAPFRLSRTPVTVAQYAEFRAAPGDERLPVTYVSLEEARAFCAWAGVRLPLEDEWEAAAGGGDDRLWPWGDEPPDASRAVFGGPIGGPSPVGTCAAGASAHGVLDLAGNVNEWVEGRSVVRGGSYLDGPEALRCSRRLPMHPAARDPYVGFRVAAGEGDGEARLAFDWVEIPGGEYAIGRDPCVYRGPAREDERPQHIVEVAEFELSLTPVTIAQYAQFVESSGRDGVAPGGPEDHPVTLVDWFDARAFCAWAGGRLPTEAEWEKAARGADGRRFPWGDEAADDLALVGAGLKHGAPEPVAGREGISPYGLRDMAGNVWEWVSSAYAPYPYDSADGREDADAPAERVLRGGSFASPGLDHARCAMRSHSRPERRQRHIGFRVARQVASSP